MSTPHCTPVPVPLGLPHVWSRAPLSLGYFALLLCLPSLMSVPLLSTQQALQVAKALDEELEDLKTLAKSLEEQNRSLMAQARHTVSAAEKGQVKGQRLPEFQVLLTPHSPRMAGVMPPPHPHPHSPALQ